MAVPLLPAPAMPIWTKKNPYTSAMTTAVISTMAALLRPMYYERTPRGKRISSPAKVGTAIIRPVCAGVRWKLCVMKGPIAPLSTPDGEAEVEVEKGREESGGCVPTLEMPGSSPCKNSLKGLCWVPPAIARRGASAGGGNVPSALRAVEESQSDGERSTRTAHCLKLGSQEMRSNAPRVTRLELASGKWKGIKTWPGATMPVIRSST
jgi:hypothetical protein